MLSFLRRRNLNKAPAIPSASWKPERKPQRRYLDADDPAVAYPLPKDEGERQRLEFQHRALTLTLGNLYLAPLPPRIRTILDVGTGTGIWPLETARLYPHALMLGLDMDTKLFRPDAGNCLLREGNVLTGLPLPDALFDFTHQRFLVFAIPTERWPSVVHELVRVTRAGGWIELVETDARVANGGPATTQIFAWIDQVRARRGIMGKPVLRLAEMLEGERVTDVESRVIPLKVGEWGERPGKLMAQDILSAVEALKEPCCGLGVNPADYERTMQEMAEEWKQMRPYVTIYAAYGRKAP